MTTQEVTTTNIADFGYTERKELIALLQAWHEQGLPDDFSEDEVHPMFNRNSGHVFLTNSEYQVAMLTHCGDISKDRLEIWHNCPNCGHEGFEEDCKIDESGEYIGCNVCKEKDPENAIRGCF